MTYKTAPLRSALVGGFAAGLLALAAAPAAAVTDTTPPTITVPADITVAAADATGAVVAYAVTFADPDDTVATSSCTPASGARFTLGTTTVSCTATDTHANTATATFKVLVADQAPPALTVPGPLTAKQVTAAGAPVSYTVAATDNVDGTVSVGCTQASGTTFPVGVTTVTCTATDKAANKSSRAFTVTVAAAGPPVITVPAFRTLGALNAGGLAVDYAVSATDPIDGTAPVTCTPASGATFPVGLTTVSCTAAASGGRTAVKTFDVAVNPPDAPPVPGRATIESARTKGSKATIVVLCTGSDTSTCDPKLELLVDAKHHRGLAATRTLSMGGGEKTTTRLHLNAAARLKLKRLHTLTYSLTLTQHPGGGKATTKTISLAFKA